MFMPATVGYCSVPLHRAVYRSAIGSSFIGYDQETFCGVFKPYNVVAPSLTTCFSLEGSSLKNLPTRRAPENRQHQAAHARRWRDGHFREHRIFFQFSQLRLRTLRRSIHAKPSPSRNRRKCSTFYLWRRNGRRAGADLQSLADICCHLALHIFFAVRASKVASAQSSSVISVSGKRAEAEADGEEKV